MQACRQEPCSSQYLTCFICQHICELPRLCPKCTKTFCQHCLEQINTHPRSECPSCSAPMRFSDFLPPQIVISLTNSIAEKVKRQIRRSEDRENCVNHELPLSYFCVQCNLPLCADCGMLTTKHTGHKFVSYRDIYQRVKRKIQAQFPRFQRKLTKLEEGKSILQTKLLKLQAQYRRYKKYFQQSWLTYTEKLDSMAKSKYQVVIAKEIANAQRLQELETLRDTIYQQMQTKTQLSLIRQAGSLTQSISALSCQEPTVVSAQLGIEEDDLIEIIPEYIVWQYTLTDFSTKNGIIYSEPKCVNGVEWRLKIYPKGNGLAREKYLSVFVQMSKGFTGQNKYQYRIELINPVHPSLTVRREYCSTFEIGECWGYNQFQPLEHLAVKEYLVNDCLVFQVGIRNRTYRALVSQQLEYINVLKRQLAEKQKSQKSQLDSRSKRLRMKMKQGQCTKQKSSSQREKCEQKREFMLQSSTLQRIKDFIMRDNKQ